MPRNKIIPFNFTTHLKLHYLHTLKSKKFWVKVPSIERLTGGGAARSDAMQRESSHYPHQKFVVVGGVVPMMMGMTHLNSHESGITRRRHSIVIAALRLLNRPVAVGLKQE